MPARRLLSLVVIAALLPLTACDGDELISSGLDNVDWVAVAGRDLNCGQGVRLIAVARHDITGDGDNEAFVVMRCKDPQISADQLEVFDGAGKASDPPIAVLTRNWTGPGDRPLDMEHGCVSMVGDQVIVRGRRWSSGEKEQKEQKIWRWSTVGKKDRRLVLETTSADDRRDLLTTLCFHQK